MPRRMIEREPQRGQRLAAARRHREREQARRQIGFGADLFQDLTTQPIQVGVSGEARHMGLEPLTQLEQKNGQRRPVAISAAVLEPIIEGFGVAIIGVDEAGKQHSYGR